MLNNCCGKLPQIDNVIPEVRWFCLQNKSRMKACDHKDRFKEFYFTQEGSRFKEGSQ